ncbi:MAG: replicative DNA helicase [Bacteroidota bacterium]
MAENNPLKSLPGQRLKRVGGDSDLSNLVYGKVQPQAIPLEQAVLGSIMIDKDAITSVLDILQPEAFYKKAHSVIYKAMMHLFDKSLPIDILTVNEALKKSGELELAGGPQYLVELTNMVASSANIEYHARIVSQKNIQRELIKVSTRIINDSFEETKDVFELLDDAEKGLFDITRQHLNRGSQSVGKIAIKAQKMLEELAQKEQGITGIPTGFSELDKLTSGWQPSDLIIVAARPGMGKTAFTLALAKNAALDFSKPVAIFSLEMANIQLVTRLISMEAEIPGSKLRNAQLEEYEWQQVHSAVEKLSQAKIFIDDTPGINIFELRAKCRRLKMQEDIQMVIIDYLQLMSGGPENKKGNREQEISSISRALKGMAKELNVPVIALSQLSRAVETRGGDKRPMLSDLRESGAIEQDADIVTFIYRPGYYDLEEDEVTPEGLTEIIVAKHRNGALDTVNLRFVGRYAKFVDYEEIDFANIDVPEGFQPMNQIITRPSKMNEDDGGDIPF